MRRRYGEDFYVVKMDVRHFFDEIDRVILYRLLAKDIEDPELIGLLARIIYSDRNTKGVPIGNYTSQYFANIYLDRLDKFVKNVLRLPYYVRYMDDLTFLAPDKWSARRTFRDIREFLQSELALEINNKNGYAPVLHGVDFVGYRIFPDYILLRKATKSRLWRIENAYRAGELSFEEYYDEVKGWLGHAMHADAYRFAHATLGDNVRYFRRFLR